MIIMFYYNPSSFFCLQKYTPPKSTVRHTHSNTTGPNLNALILVISIIMIGLYFAFLINESIIYEK